MKTAPALALLLLASLASTTRAGNQDTYPLSNQAALTGGSVLAVTQGGGSAWYNPAGLGGIGWDSVDLTGSAFLVRFNRIPDFVRATSPDSYDAQTVSDSELYSVPSALVLTRRLGDDLTGALGIFVPVMSSGQAAGRLETGGGASELREYFVDVKYQQTFYYLAAALGWRINPRLRLGGSLMLVYYNALTSEALSAEVTPDPLDPSLDSFAVMSRRMEDIRLGGQLVLGLQWEPIDGWVAGLVLRSPLMQVYQDLLLRAQYGSSGISLAQELSEGLTTESLEQSSTGFDAAFPVRLHLGFAHRFDRGFVNLEGDIQPAHSNREVGVEQESVWNARLGGRLALNDWLALGVGLFTDRSPEERPTAFGNFRVDYYGIAVGAEFRSAHALADRPDPEALVFSTTVSLRYALGLGQVGCLDLGLDENMVLSTEVFSTDVTFHEISLHVGSVVYF